MQLIIVIGISNDRSIIGLGHVGVKSIVVSSSFAFDTLGVFVILFIFVVFLIL